jgi:hypothetical protein
MPSGGTRAQCWGHHPPLLRAGERPNYRGAVSFHLHTSPGWARQSAILQWIPALEQGGPFCVFKEWHPF